jgi:hypothetical protein
VKKISGSRHKISCLIITDYSIISLQKPLNTPIATNQSALGLDSMPNTFENQAKILKKYAENLSDNFQRKDKG